MTTSETNFDAQLQLAIINLVASLELDKNKARWIRAFERAAAEIESNDLMTWDGRELQSCSRTSGNLYRARANFCECQAYKEGFPCYHRAAARIMLEQDRQKKEN